jgi:alpha-D-ribose 1-methylphosphonate 5-triphosphate synthase subunit PhnI
MREAEGLIDAFRKGLVHPERDDLSAPQPEAIEGGLRFAVYKVMSEAGIYAPRLAAIAIQQAEGDLMEAAFLLRAFRACLPRWGTTLPADTAEMRAIRRISAAFKEVPGGQFLGP